ncbi:MAG: hypothetical protein JNM93_03070 [Bacteriovoracaceae bacterium]|nr:hypothetical protein [Bacteriovoracaceae bacterium]
MKFKNWLNFWYNQRVKSHDLGRVSDSFFSSLFILLFIASCSKGINLDQDTNELDSVTLTVNSGDGQFAPLNSTFTLPLRVQITGLADVENIPVYFEVVSGTSVTFATPIANTDVGGFAQTMVNSGASSGVSVISAKVFLATGTVEVFFNIFVTGTATQWRVTASTATPTAGVPFTITVEALIMPAALPDATINGNMELFFTSTNGSSPAPVAQAASLPADGLHNFVAGVATFPVTLFNSSENGADTFVVNVSGSGLVADNTANLQVLDNVPTKIRIVDTNVCNSTEITTFTITVPNPEYMYSFYYDAWDNCIEGIAATGDWGKTFPDGGLNFMAPFNFTNTQTIRLDPYVVNTGTISVVGDPPYNALTDTTGLVTIDDGSPDHFIITGFGTEGNFTFTAGTPLQVRLEARDIRGNVATAYDGSNLPLNWSTTGTATVPPAALPVAANAPSIPTNGALYNFSQGVLIPPRPTTTFFRTSENPDLTVNDGVLIGNSGPLTINNTAHTYNLVRSAAAGAGGDANTFVATAATRTADDSYNLYCATYDSYGNYLIDSAAAIWSETSAPAAVMVLGGNVTPGAGPVSAVTFAPTLVGTGTLTCTVGAISDNTGLFTIVPGAPKSWGIDGGSGDGLAFTETAGTLWSFNVNLYDSDGNFASNYTNAAYPVQLNYIGSTVLDSSLPSEITPTYTQPRIETTPGVFKATNLNIVSGTATVANNLLINDTEAADEPRLVLIDPSFVITTALSGLITVNQGPLAFMSIRTANNNGGVPVSAATTMTTDTALALYAAGYDNSGNYIGDQNSNWSAVAPVGNCVAGDLTPVPGPITATQRVNFDADTAPGTCTITTQIGAVSDNTGAITISNGVATNFLVQQVGGSTTVTAGTPFNVRITARDADLNQVLNYTPLAVYTFTHTNGASPEGTAPSVFPLVTADWSSGQATVTNVTVYDAVTTTPFTITATGGAVTGTSANLTVNPNTLHHYATRNPVGPYVADSASGFQVEVQARDQWGNPTTTGIGANVNLSMVRTADEALVGTIGGGSALVFGPGSSATYSGLTYGVSHAVQIVATDTGSVTTPAAQRTTATFTPVANTVTSYSLINIPNSATAGAGFTARIQANDIAGNVITGLDALLGTYNFTTASPAATTPVPYSIAPSHHTGVIPFTSGVSDPINFNFFAEESINKNLITVNDGLGDSGNGGAGSITIDADVLHHYANLVSPGAINADGVSTFSATITARDIYGNIATGDSNIDLIPFHITPQTVGNLGGSTTNLNLVSGTHTVSDLTYDVFGTMELRVTGGSVTMNSVRSFDYTFNAVIGSLDHYEITFASPVTAGNTLALTVTAKDASNNTLTGLDATLNARTFTITNFGTSQEGDTPTLPTTPSVAFAGGVATFNVVPRLAEVIAIGNIDIIDSGAISGTSTIALTVNPDAADHIVFTGNNTGTADNTTNYALTIQSRDQFGNPVATGNAADASLDLLPVRIFGAVNVGPLTGTGITTIDLQNNATVTINDIRYQVPHTVRWGFTTASSVAIDNALSVVVAWQMSTGSVASYTLVPSATTDLVAGTARTYTLTAFDGAGNNFIGEQAILNTINYTFTTNAQCDAPNASFTAAANDPANGTVVYNAAGTATLTWNFYNSESGLCNDVVGDVTYTDTTNTLGPFNPTARFNIIPNVADHFTTTVPGGFSATGSANGTNQTTTAVDITLEDVYGNDTTDATFIGVGYLALNKVSGYGALNGTLRACSPANGDGCGGLAQDITTIPLNFSATAVQRIHDLSYTVGNVVEIIATNGAITTTGALATNLTFNSVAGTVASYTFEKDAPLTGTAGTAQSWTVTAYDLPGNIMTGAANQTVLSALTMTITDMSAGALNSPEGTAPSLPGAGTQAWTALGTFTYTNLLTFYDAAVNVLAGNIRISDGTVSVTNTNAVVMSPGTANHVHASHVGFAGTESANGTTDADSVVTFTMHDTWGNPTTTATPVTMSLAFVANNGYTAPTTGTMTGTLTDGGATANITGLALDFSASSTDQLFDLGYNVGHICEIRVTGAGIATAAADTQNLAWNSAVGTINNYLFAPVNASEAAGTHTWRLTARDAANNVMNDTGSGNQGFLISRTFTFNYNGGVQDAPDAGNTASVPVAGPLLWTAAGTVDVTGFNFYNASATVAIGHIDVNDGVIFQQNTSAQTITKAANAEVHFVTQPSNAVVNVNNAPSITARITDIYGNVDTAGGVNITLAIDTDPSGGVPNAANLVVTNPRTTAAGTGLATFNNARLRNAATGYRLRATSPAMVMDVSNTFDITPGANADVRFVSQPTNEVAGVVIAPNITVEHIDAWSNRTTSTANITLSIFTDPSVGATFGGTLTRAAVAGLATFNDITINKIGTGFVLRAVNGAFNDNSSTFNITPGPAASLTWFVQPSNVTTDNMIAPSMVIRILDANANLTTDTNNVTLSIFTDPSVGATLGGTVTRAAVGGVATFNDIDINKIGNGFVLRADRAPSVGAVNSAAFNVTPGADNRVSFVQEPTNVVAGANIAPSITVEILDADLNRTTSTSNVNLVFSTDPSAGVATLGGTLTQAAVAGLATFNNINIDKAFPSYRLEANSGVLTIDLSAFFDVTPAAKSDIRFITQPSNVTTDNNIAPSMTVEIIDVYGNRTADTDNITLSINTNPGGSVLGGTAMQAAVAGLATFNDINLDKVGTNYNLLATSGGFTDTSANFNVTHGVLDHLSWTTQPVSNETINKNFATQPVVELLDADNNRITTGVQATSTINITDTACAGGTSPGAIAGGSVAAVAGVATFTTLQYSAAGTVSFQARDAGMAAPALCMSGTTVVYDTLQILPPGGMNSNDTFTYVVAGGVPPLVGANFSTNNSGAIITSGPYACAPDICYDIQVGADGGMNDTFQVFDSAAVTNTDTDTYAVSGGRLVLDGTSDPLSFGSVAIDTSQDYVFRNTGDVAIISATTTFTPVVGVYWSIVDGCNGAAIPVAGTCTISVTFLAGTGGVPAASGPHNADLQVTGDTGGDITITVSGSKP